MVEKSVVNNKGKCTGQREVRPVWNNARRVNHQNFSKMTHPHPKRNFIPTYVATKLGQVLANAAKQNSTTSTSTARPKVNTAAIRPNGNPQYTLQDQEIFDSRCSRHMTGNKSFLTKYQAIDGGFVAFGGSPKGGKITDHLGKFDGKVDEGFLVGYSVNSKACRVFNSRTRKVEENLHVNFLKNKPNITGSGPGWLFDIDSLTKSINYEPVSTRNKSNGDAGIQTDIYAGQASQEKATVHKYILLPFISSNPPLSLTIQSSDVNAGDQLGDVNARDIQGDVNEISRNDNVCQENETRIDSSTYAINAASTSINTASNIIAAGSLNINIADSNHTNMLTLEATGIFDGAFDDRDLGAEADTTNLDSSIVFSPILTTIVHKDHPKEQIIGDPNLNTQTRRMINFSKEIATVSFINRQRKTNHKDFQNCLFACFLSQMEPMKVFRNKLDERGIVIRNKARLVAQGHTQEEGINYDEMFAAVARIEEIRLFLAYALFQDFIVYQMDVKSAFLYEKIEEEVYICQPPRFDDTDFPDKVYKVKKALYGLQAPRARYETLSTYLLNNGFKRGQIEKTLFIKRNKGDILLVQMRSMGELTFFLGLHVKQKQDGIFISQDKYVAEILKKFRFSEVKTASTPIETSKPLLKDKDGQEVDVHIYRSMIGSFMYLTSSRPDIMFAVCTCARYQVSPKVSHLHAVKRIFRYLKSQPKLGLWYLKDSPFELEAYTDSDYARSSLDTKSTTGGCQFLGCRLISWQCKKKTVVANSTTEADAATWKLMLPSIKLQLLVTVNAAQEESIRSDLHFDDAEGTACLLNEEIFEGLARMDMGDTPVETHQTPVVDQPSTSKPQKKQKPRRKQRKEAEGDRLGLYPLVSPPHRQISMANLLEDIQCAGSDTRPPMLDRTDFPSWQQRIRLYFWGKENGVNILKSIDEGPYQIGIVHETLAESTEGAPQFGQERPRVYSDLTPEEKDRFVTDVKLNRGLRDSNYDQLYAYLKQYETHAKENKMMLERFSQNTVDTLALMSNVSNPQRYSPSSSTSSSTQVPQPLADNPHLNSSQGMNPRGGSAAGYGGAQNRVGNVNLGQARPVKCYNCNGGQDNTFDDDVDEQPVQDLALNVDNVFQADDCDVFDSDVDKAPTAQTMFML
nr:hypothetical protein [Tanacetum cinerariifolium]